MKILEYGIFLEYSTKKVTQQKYQNFGIWMEYSEKSIATCGNVKFDQACERRGVVMAEARTQPICVHTCIYHRTTHM